MSLSVIVFSLKYYELEKIPVSIKLNSTVFVELEDRRGDVSRGPFIEERLTEYFSREEKYGRNTQIVYTIWKKRTLFYVKGSIDWRLCWIKNKSYICRHNISYRSLKETKNPQF
jgi:hypothetical protein